MEKEESLVDWLDRNIDERMRRLGFTLQETISSKQGRQDRTSSGSNWTLEDVRKYA